MVPVVIFGVFVLAGGVALLLMMRSGDDAVAEPTGETVTATERAPTPTDRDRSGSTPTVTPTLPGETPAGLPGEVKEYVVGDRRVRDHRSGDRAPIDIPPSVHPAEARRIDSKVTYDVGQKLKVFVKECVAALPAGAKREGARLEGKVVISIKAKQVTVKEAVVQLREVADASVASIKKCIEEKALTVTQETQEIDLESYDITVSYAL